jgi:hypothetical protein
MALSRAEAAKALARIETNADARAKFLAAYTGDEDAVAALREAADPGAPSAASEARAERLKNWQRIAYGRTATPDEVDAAAHARDEIAWEEDHRAVIAAALESAVLASVDAPVPNHGESAAAFRGTAAEPVDAPAEPAEARHTGMRFSVPVVIAVAVVGVAVGALVTTGAFATRPIPTVTETPNVEFESSGADAHVGTSITRTYSTKQVDGWFAATAETADTFPQPNYLSFIGLHDSNTRFVTTQATGWSLWVGKSTSGITCLLINGTIKNPAKSLSSCAPAKAIAGGTALVIDSNGINATLTKRDLVVAITNSTG